MIILFQLVVCNKEYWQSAWHIHQSIRLCLISFCLRCMNCEVFLIYYSFACWLQWSFVNACISKGETASVVDCCLHQITVAVGITLNGLHFLWPCLLNLNKVQHWLKSFANPRGIVWTACSWSILMVWHTVTLSFTLHSTLRLHNLF